jgi:hypothetical protein
MTALEPVVWGSLEPYIDEFYNTYIQFKFPSGCTPIITREVLKSLENRFSGILIHRPIESHPVDFEYVYTSTGWTYIRLTFKTPLKRLEFPEFMKLINNP